MVERASFKVAGSRFQSRGAATENASSPIFRLVLRMTITTSTAAVNSCSVW